MDKQAADELAIKWWNLIHYNRQTKAQIRTLLSKLPEPDQQLVRERLQHHEPAFKAKRGIR